MTSQRVSIHSKRGLRITVKSAAKGEIGRIFGKTRFIQTNRKGVIDMSSDPATRTDRLHFRIYDKQHRGIIKSLNHAFDKAKVGEVVEMTKGKKKYTITRVK